MNYHQKYTNLINKLSALNIKQVNFNGNESIYFKGKPYAKYAFSFDESEIRDEKLFFDDRVIRKPDGRKYNLSQTYVKKKEERENIIKVLSNVDRDNYILCAGYFDKENKKLIDFQIGITESYNKDETHFECSRRGVYEELGILLKHFEDKGNNITVCIVSEDNIDKNSPKPLLKYKSVAKPKKSFIIPYGKKDYLREIVKNASKTDVNENYYENISVEGEKIDEIMIEFDERYEGIKKIKEEKNSITIVMLKVSVVLDMLKQIYDKRQNPDREYGANKRFRR